MATVARETGGRAAGSWIVDETDYGEPMVEHGHPDGAAVAYVLFGRNGGSFAQCTQCGDRLQLPHADRRPFTNA